LPLLGKRFRVAGALERKIAPIVGISRRHPSWVHRRRMAAQDRKEDRAMTSVIERNGISGLLLRGAVIAFAAVMFGCAPKAAAAQSDVSATLSPSAR